MAVSVEGTVLETLPHGLYRIAIDRQREVVALIAAGCSNDEVGHSLGISARTAKAHSDALRLKLGVARRRQIPAAYRLLTGEDPYVPPLVRLHPPRSR